MSLGIIPRPLLDRVCAHVAEHVSDLDPADCGAMLASLAKLPGSFPHISKLILHRTEELAPALSAGDCANVLYYCGR